MTREELEKLYYDFIDEYTNTYTCESGYVDLKTYRNACIRYGINKICEEYIDENGMCLGKYKSAEEVIKELDEE